MDSVSKRFADLLLSGKKGRWAAEVTHTSGGVVVHRWDGHFWSHIGDGEGHAHAAKWLDWAAPEKATERGAMGAWNYASLRLRMERSLPRPPQGRVIVPCADVYLEMGKDGSITSLAPDPELGMTYAMTVSAGTSPGMAHVLPPLPPTSRFRQWLEAAQPDPEVRALLQEQCGMTLLPGVFSVAAWWYGEAGAGKSMLAELCEAMQRKVARINLDTLNDQFGLESIVGASLVIVDEVEQEKWAEGRFKSLVSGNGVSVNRKHEKALLSYHSMAKWIITSNPAPFVRDKSDGTWRRLCVVKWDVVLPAEQRIENFHKILMEQEGDLILNWMLEGARRIVMRGRFLSEAERPTVVQQIKLEARTNSDSVLAWIEDEHVRVEEGTWKPLVDVYNHYLVSCEAAQRSPLETTPFWRAVHSNPRLHGVKKSNKRVGGTQKWFVNITWGALPPSPPPPAKKEAAEIDPPVPVWADGSEGDFLPFTYTPEEARLVGWRVRGVGGPVLTFETEQEADVEVAKRRKALSERSLQDGGTST